MNEKTRMFLARRKYFCYNKKEGQGRSNITCITFKPDCKVTGKEPEENPPTVLIEED